MDDAVERPSPLHGKSKSADHIHMAPCPWDQDGEQAKRPSRPVSWLSLASAESVIAPSNLDMHRILDPLAWHPTRRATRESSQPRQVADAGQGVGGRSSSVGHRGGSSVSLSPPRRAQSSMLRADCRRGGQNSRRSSGRACSPFSDPGVDRVSDHPGPEEADLEDRESETTDALLAKHQGPQQDRVSLSQSSGRPCPDAQVSWLLDLSETPDSPPPALPSDTLSDSADPVSPSLRHRSGDGLAKKAPPRRLSSLTLHKDKKSKNLDAKPAAGARLEAKVLHSKLAESVSGSHILQRLRRLPADDMRPLSSHFKHGCKNRDRDMAKAQAQAQAQAQADDSTLTPKCSEDNRQADVAQDQAAPSNLPVDEAVVCQDFSLPKDGAAQHDFTIDSFAFPTVPTRNSTRHTTKPRMKLLPTIPEVTKTHLRPPLSPNSPDSHQTGPSDEHVIFLRSTTLSSANRSFRHGPIALCRPDAGQGSADSSDQRVDWAAFQMAILGGAGELASRAYDEDERQMADDVAEWFETFGFETHGELIAGEADQQGGRCSSWSSCASSARSPRSSTANSDMDLPIPVECQGPLDKNYWQGGLDQGADAGKLSMDKFLGSSGVRRWPVAEADRQRSKPRRAPAAVPRVAEPEPSAETTAMACNLEHDLGDFLRWEAAYVNGQLD
ncbi:hypothetical protein CDD82_5639 [Ophiocordyceps australis]|uniref:Uncharacterized protein n=1 Tax=Ophiocordyceps australis TaxID=1399860 RepID=A0A2C5ZRA2_9HYPO|nr:hypothetical protein CDD82_5639 [Ophiocordyceps australis]